MKHGVGLAFAALILASTTAAQAQPEPPPTFQWNSSFLLGAATYGTSKDLWQTTRFAAAMRAEGFWGRTSNRAFGYGPMASIGFTTLHEVSAAAGGQLLLPVHEYLPFVVGAGLYGTDREAQEARLGGFASLAWGVRSFNYHSPYAMAGGLLLEARRDFAHSPVTTWLASIQLDAAALALPVIWAINAFR